MTLTGTDRVEASSRQGPAALVEKLPQLTERGATGGFLRSIHAESGTLVKQIIHL